MIRTTIITLTSSRMNSDLKTKTSNSSSKCSQEENSHRLKIKWIIRCTIFHRHIWHLSLLVNSLSMSVVEVSLIPQFRPTLKTLKFNWENKLPNIKNLILNKTQEIKRTSNYINSWLQTCLRPSLLAPSDSRKWVIQQPMLSLRSSWKITLWCKTIKNAS